MGGMHAWLWAVGRPGAVDAVMPLACQPTPIIGRNAIWRKLVADAIRNDAGWNGGAYQAQPKGLLAASAILVLMASSAIDLQRNGPTREIAIATIDKAAAALAAGKDANDLLYQFDASRTYDASQGLEQVSAAVMAVNSADDMFNPPELGVMEREIRRVPRGQYVLLPVSDATHGHTTYSRIPSLGRLTSSN